VRNALSRPSSTVEAVCDVESGYVVMWSVLMQCTVLTGVVKWHRQQTALTCTDRKIIYEHNSWSMVDWDGFLTLASLCHPQKLVGRWTSDGSWVVRHCASVVLAVPLCLSVRPSVTSRGSIKTVQQIIRFLAPRLPLAYPTLCWREFEYLQKGTSLWNFIPDLEKFHNCTSTTSNVVNVGGRSVW